MTVWQILGIQPTSDQRAIKKAYAKQLKLIDQENDPQAFMQLREALNEAQMEAYYLDEEEEQNNEHDDWYDQTQTNQELSTEIQPSEHETQIADNLRPNDNESNDPLELIEIRYQEFITAISQQDSRYRFNDALYEMNIYLQDISTQDQQHYQNKIHSTLHTYGLEQFIHIVQVDQNTQFENNDQIFTEKNHVSHEPSYSNFDISSNNDVEMYDEIDKTASSHLTYESENTQTTSLSLGINQLTDAINQHHFNSQNYQFFVEILNDFSKLSLSEQFDYRDQIEYALGDVDLEEYNQGFADFILLWNQHFPSEQDCLNHSYHQSRIHWYVEYYEKQQHLHQSLPEDLQPTLKTLTDNQSLKPLSMLNLQAYLRRKYTEDFVENFYHNLDIKTPSFNANLIYLNTVNEWKSSLWLLVLWVIATISFFSSQFDLSALSKIFIGLGGIVWFVLIQAPIKAKLLGHENRDYHLLRLNQIWFISGLILIATAHLINTHVHQSLSYIWVLLTLIIFSCAQYSILQPFKTLLFQSQQVVADPWIIGVMSILFTYGLLALYSHQFDPTSIWLMTYSLIPIGFVMFNSYFYSLYTSFGRRMPEIEYTNEHTEEEIALEQQKYDARKKMKTAVSIVLRGIVLSVIIYVFLNQPLQQYDFYLSLLSYLFILILGLPPRVLTTLLKYLCYVVLIISSSLTIIFPLIAGFILFRTAREDYRERKARNLNESSFNS